MKILLVTGSFAGGGRQPWLLDDLAVQFINMGHTVDVILTDTKFARRPGLQPKYSLAPESRLEGLRVFSAGPSRIYDGTIGKFIGYCTAGYRLHTRALHWAKKHQYDICIFTSIASFSWGFPSRVKHEKIARKTILFLWDFFPIHQIEIGRIKNTHLAEFMKFIERQAIRGADTVALMSRANVDFFRRYHRDLKCKTIIIPPWSAADLNSQDSESRSSLHVIFGGQIAKGRGVDVLINVASQLSSLNSNVQFLIAGDGPERPAIEAEANRRGLDNVTFLGVLPREEYREVARSVDLGIAITVAGVSPPSFPSKIIEYCSLGLPVLVCVEASSDADEIITSAGAGFSAPAGEVNSIVDAICMAESEHVSGELLVKAASARHLFESVFSVQRVVEKLTESIMSDSDGSSN